LHAQRGDDSRSSMKAVRLGKMICKEAVGRAGAILANPATAAWAAVIAAGVGFYVASYQIKVARDTLRAGTLYSIEKDFSSIVSKVEEDAFQDCFGTGQDASPFDRAAICADVTARRTFFDLLVFYRMLLELGEVDAVSKTYINRRVRAACPFFLSPRGKNTMEEYKAKELVEQAVRDLVRSICTSQQQ
jgi:hypothetical protein